VRHVGLSEVSVAQLIEAERITPIASVQDRYNLTDRASEDVLEYCETRGIAFIPWLPVHPRTMPRPQKAGSGLTQRAHKGARRCRRAAGRGSPQQLQVIDFAGSAGTMAGWLVARDMSQTAVRAQIPHLATVRGRQLMQLDTTAGHRGRERRARGRLRSGRSERWRGGRSRRGGPVCPPAVSTAS
jgi:hypothetical protein